MARLYNNLYFGISSQTIRKASNPLYNLLFSSLFFMFVGIHFTGITNGHQLSQILPIISELILLGSPAIIQTRRFIKILFGWIFLSLNNVNLKTF